MYCTIHTNLCSFAEKGTYHQPLQPYWRCEQYAAPRDARIASIYYLLVIVFSTITIIDNCLLRNNHNFTLPMSYKTCIRMFTLVMMMNRTIPKSTIAMANSVQTDVVTDNPSPNGFIGNLSLLARLATVAIKPEHLLKNSTERCELKRRGLTLMTAHISLKPYQLRNSHPHLVMNQFPEYRQKT